VTDALGRSTTTERDLLGRPTRITYADGASTTLQYDQGTVGHLSSITDASGTTTYERDNLGRVTRKSQTLASGLARSIGYQYDASGLLIATTYPGGRTLQYQRDATGQITALIWAGQPIVQGITWTPLGQPQGWQWTLPGAATSLPGSRSYNSAGQTTATETTSQQYDAAGRIQTLTQNLWHPADTEPGQSTIAQTPTTWAATYDRAGRLTALTKTSGSGPTQDTTTYQYDPNGNLTSSKRSARSTGTGKGAPATPRRAPTLMALIAAPLSFGGACTTRSGSSMKGITWSMAWSTSMGVRAWLMAALFTRTSMSASYRGRAPNAASTVAPLSSTMPS
jgi:YD repeat-containing protein